MDDKAGNTHGSDNIALADSDTLHETVIGICARVCNIKINDSAGQWRLALKSTSTHGNKATCQTLDHVQP